jgi:D-alanyl-D-alanine carboxypeptidase
MNFTPGTKQQYSHTDNVLLGQVIERATGQSIKALYDRYLFGPLGMKDTQFPLDQEIQAPVLHAYSTDRNLYEDCTYWNPSWGSTPGLPTSSLHDLGKWGPIFGTGRLLSPASFREQVARPLARNGHDPSGPYFAYGFVVDNGWLAQNPSINGYSGGFGYHMATGVTIVVEATKGPTATSDHIAFDILREVTKYATPATPITF